MRDMLERHPQIAMGGEHPWQHESVFHIYWRWLYEESVHRTKIVPRHAEHSLQNAEHVEHTLRHAPHDSHSRLHTYGFKVKLPVLQGLSRDARSWRGRDRLPDVLEWLRCLNGRLLCLSRRNWVKHTVSRLKQQIVVRECGTWSPTHAHLNRTGCRARVDRKDLPLRRVRAELRETRQSLRRLEQVCSGERERYGVDALGEPRVRSVAYEDLAYGRSAQYWGALQRWLGTSPLNLTTELVKMTGPKLSVAIRNFPQLEALVASAYGRNSTELRLLQEV